MLKVIILSVTALIFLKTNKTSKSKCKMRVKFNKTMIRSGNGQSTL